MANAKNPLEQELAFYEQHKAEWLMDYENQFVVIAENKVAGFCKDYESAWDVGTNEFGLKANFLIKQICVHEPVYLLY